MEYSPIGTIHSPHKDKEQCPIQPLYSDEAEGRVEVFAPFEDGLRDIKPYIPRFDAVASASNGWVQDTEWRRKPKDRE